MREPPLRQRYTAMLGHLMRSRIHPAPTGFCRPMMRHAGAPLPIWAFRPRLSSSAPACRTNCSRKQRPTGPSGIAGGRTVRRWRRNAEIRLRSAKGCLASRYLRKISANRHASIGWVCQGAGFHATFSLAAALCDAVWPNRPSNDVPAAAKMTANRKWRSTRP
jgi:hypothetical protein